MTITPLELLDTSIAQLQTLVAFLDDQLDGTELATAETCACKEISRSLCRLIGTYGHHPVQGDGHYGVPIGVPAHRWSR